MALLLYSNTPTALGVTRTLLAVLGESKSEQVNAEVARSLVARQTIHDPFLSVEQQPVYVDESACSEQQYRFS